MVTGLRLIQWSPSCLMISTPATEMSAPELGRAVSRVDLLGVENWAFMVGAHSTFRPFAMKDESEDAVETSSAFSGRSRGRSKEPPLGWILSTSK